ncbi:MAG: hypothetical protein E7E74_09350, partial [Finegoldia magna]|nr:hypothetical protein [Finegoldia magna]
KYRAVVREVIKRHATGQPILVGTTSINQSEILSQLLNKENIVLPKKTLRLNIDTGVMKDSDGNIYHSDTKPVIINGRVHASISNIAKAFNATCGDIKDGKDQSIEWDNNKKAVYVFKNIK